MKHALTTGYVRGVHSLLEILHLHLASPALTPGFSHRFFRINPTPKSKFKSKILTSAISPLVLWEDMSTTKAGQDANNNSTEARTKEKTAHTAHPESMRSEAASIVIVAIVTPAPRKRGTKAKPNKAHSLSRTIVSNLDPVGGLGQLHILL
jgi:hypothetical protein